MRIIGLIGWLLAGVSLILFVVLPFQFYPLKLAVLLPALIIGWAVKIRTGEAIIDRRVLGIIAFYTLHGLLWISYGILVKEPVRHAPLYVSALYVGYPTAWLAIISAVPTSRLNIQYIDKALIACSVFVGMYMMAIAANAVGLISLELLDPNEYLNVSLKRGTIQMKYHGITSLAFLSPYLIARVVIGEKNRTSRNLAIGFSLFLCILAIFLSGRRAVMLLLPVSCVIALGIRIAIDGRITNTLLRQGIMLFGLAGIISMVAAYLLEVYIGVSILETVYQLVDSLLYSTLNASNLERVRQAPALLDGWAANPLLGAGHGARADYVRSVLYPWRYELSYLANLFHTGIVGCVWYGLLVLAYIKYLWNACSDSEEGRVVCAGMVGAICLLLAYATNPYLDAFDIQWTIYLPLVLASSMDQLASYRS